jgi:hypothetical protein
MRSIQNLERKASSCWDDKKRALSCVALKKEGPKIRASSLIPPAPAAARPALEGKISKARKDRGRHLILFARTSGSEKHSERAPRSFR